jgi:hypothetical protein
VREVVDTRRNSSWVIDRPSGLSSRGLEPYRGRGSAQISLWADKLCPCRRSADHPEAGRRRWRQSCCMGLFASIPQAPTTRATPWHRPPGGFIRFLQFGGLVGLDLGADHAHTHLRISFLTWCSQLLAITSRMGGARAWPCTVIEVISAKWVRAASFLVLRSGLGGDEQVHTPGAGTGHGLTPETEGASVVICLPFAVTFLSGMSSGSAAGDRLQRRAKRKTARSPNITKIAAAQISDSPT